MPPTLCTILKISALIHKRSTRLPLSCMFTQALCSQTNYNKPRTFKKFSRGLGLKQGVNVSPFGQCVSFSVIDAGGVLLPS